MSIRFKLIAALTGVHLLLVACGAAHVNLGRITPLRSLLTAYGSYSGANMSYGFFAPSVSPQLSATFTMRDARGRSWQETGLRGDTNEANLRLASTINMVSYPEHRDAVARSWAASMFGRYPNATEVRMQVTSQLMPYMDAYRAGLRPKWEVIYEGKFTRGR